jgi:FHA domain-containing protein
MKLTAISQQAHQDFLPFSANFEAPGGTIGRCAGNRMVLPSPEHDICRLQAVLRISDKAWHLKNMSAMSTVLVNGRPVLPSAEVMLRAGDTLVIGPYLLRSDECGLAWLTTPNGTASANS